MDRKEFLSLLGMGAAGLVIPACMGGCSKTGSSSATTLSSDLTLDLSTSTYSSLKTSGSYITLSQGIVVANIKGTYYAVQSTCPHEGGSIVSTSSAFTCTKHSNAFTTSGTSTGSYTSTSLKSWTTSLSGNILTIKAG